MTGPEHYARAEQYLSEADELGDTATDRAARTEMMARAQVHATLALAAATALGAEIQEVGFGQSTSFPAAMTAADIKSWKAVAAQPARRRGQ